jgi:hypothetical protein
MSENKDLPTFLADRLPDSQTLINLFAQTDLDCIEEHNGNIYIYEDGTYRTEFNPNPDPHNPGHMMNLGLATEYAAELGLLRLIYPDKNGWYDAKETLPPYNCDVLGWGMTGVTTRGGVRQSGSCVVRYVPKNEVIDHDWWDRGTLHTITHWAFIKPPVERGETQ